MVNGTSNGVVARSASGVLGLFTTPFGAYNAYQNLPADASWGQRASAMRDGAVNSFVSVQKDLEHSYSLPTDNPGTQTLKSFIGEVAQPVGVAASQMRSHLETNYGDGVATAAAVGAQSILEVGGFYLGVSPLRAGTAALVDGIDAATLTAAREQAAAKLGELANPMRVDWGTPTSGLKAAWNDVQSQASQASAAARNADWATVEVNAAGSVKPAGAGWGINGNAAYPALSLDAAALVRAEAAAMQADTAAAMRPNAIGAAAVDAAPSGWASAAGSRPISPVGVAGELGDLRPGAAGSGGLSAELIAEIQGTPKGLRPDPRTYMPAEAIEGQLAQFDAGASRFMSQSNLDKYGIAQRDGTSFVMPATQADKLLATVNGNMRAMEQALGLPERFLDSNQLVRIDVPKPRELNLRVPSGNEAGANEFWIPGGRLPNGNLEAVIDAGGIAPGRFVRTPVSGANSELRQVGMSKLALLRTDGLGATSTTAELLKSGAIPGREGVVLRQRTVPFEDIWKMTEKSGIEFVLTREGGSFMLRSGSSTSAPIPGGVRPILHSHPFDSNGLNNLLPSKADINVLNNYWARNPTISRPVSQILTGQPEPTRFYATGLDPWQ